MELNDNPMVKSARNAMTPEQIEEYKKIGEYMYNDHILSAIASGKAKEIKQAGDEDLILYATEALKSGANPKDLSDKEIKTLVSVYGKNWYEKFGFQEDEVRVIVEEQITKLNRHQRRALERKLAKVRAKKK